MKILLLVTSSIAIVKIEELINLFLSTKKFFVSVVLSEKAKKYKLKLPSSLHLKYYHKENYKKQIPDHINLVNEHDFIILAPATFNTISKFANGIADDFLTSILAINKKPVLVVPAMNSHMWENPINLENVQKLKKIGHLFLGPIHGKLHCKTKGIGKIINTQNILDFVLKKNKPKVLFTFGYTKSRVDLVRSLAVFSSGKMGIALINELSLDFDLTIVNCSLPHLNSKIPAHFKIYNIDNIDQYEKLVYKLIEKNEIFISACAVSDFIFDQVKVKINKKNASGVLCYKINKDILQDIANKYPEKTHVGFALGGKNFEKIGREKFLAKKLDVLVANQNSKIYGENIKAKIFTKFFETDLIIGTKSDLAVQIKQILLKILAKK